MSHPATIAAPEKSPQTSSQQEEAKVAAMEMRYVARQPILDKNHRVQGYQLNFQLGPHEPSGGGGVQGSRTVLDDTVIFGIDRFTGGLPAFVPCTAEALKEDWVSVLPPAMTVLEIPASFEPTPQLVDQCRQLKKTGFKLALAGFSWDRMPHPLFDLADYIKANLEQLDLEARQHLLHSIKGRSTVLMAENVEAKEGFRQALGAGFSLFQGYYFCHPELIQNAKIPANRVFHMDILRLLNHETMDLKKISPLVQRDAGMTYRVLRLVNSPLYAMRHEVTSIEAAIMVLGENAFRRVATLAILSELNADHPPEILHMALVRARFCELGARTCDLDPNEQYLLGMLSLLPAMMQCPMEALAPELPLRVEIRQALLGLDNRERSLLGWIECHERDDHSAWNAIAETHGLNQQKLVQYYIDSVVWDAAGRRAKY
jgi:EAL and modified HD-GYP domain-containing signal transduction protein